MTAREQVFRTAKEYHSALRAYSRAARFGEELEEAAQAVVAAALEYRLALDRWRMEEPSNGDCRRRAQSLRKLLHCMSAKYNLAKRLSKAAVLAP